MSEPASATWSIAGEYFENCNCTVACPCIFSANAPLPHSQPRGPARCLFAFHIDQRLVRRCFAGRPESGHGDPNARPDDRGQLAGGAAMSMNGPMTRRVRRCRPFFPGLPAGRWGVRPAAGEVLGARSVPIRYWSTASGARSRSPVHDDGACARSRASWGRMQKWSP